jgi:hypothetical protein
VITRARLRELFQEVVPQLEKYPALDQEALIDKVNTFCNSDEH